MIRAFIDGLFAVALAVVLGIAVAVGLAYLGLTDTSWLRLGPWLGGMGLLGAWQQEVTSSVAGGIGWTTTATGIPLLVTGATALFVALRARRGVWWHAGPAAIGAAAASALLVAGTRSSDTVSNAAGTVTTTEGLTWFWTGNHPGTVVGAALLVGVVWLLHTAARAWWQSGRGVALSLLVGLGLVLTAGMAAGAVYLTSSTPVGLALALLYPTAGTLVLCGVAGAPAEASLTRLTPEPLVLNTWTESLLYGVAGTVAVVLLALLVGLIVRLFKHRSTWLGAVTVTAALAAFLAWAMSTEVAVPMALGAPTLVSINPLVATGIGAVLGAVVRFAAGPPKNRPEQPSQPPEGDIDALLREVSPSA